MSSESRSGEVMDDRDLLIVAERLEGGIALGSYSDWRVPTAHALRELHALRGRALSMGAPSEESLRLAREFVADPEARAQVTVRLAMEGRPQVADMIDEAVVMARELLRLSGAEQQEAKE